VNNDTLSFSIIIPTYARPLPLAGCLESLTRLESPAAGFEVIVVDDGSPQPLDEIVKPWRDRLNLTLMRQSNSGPGAARNAGAERACGRFLAFTDDDCRPASDWLTALARRFEQSPQNLLGGSTVNELTHNSYATASQILIDVVYAFYNRRPEEPRFFASNNIAVPAELFRQSGGFDPQSFPLVAAEDRDFCDRWRRQGRQMTFAREAVVWHAHDLTLRDYCKQHFTYGRGALHFDRALRNRNDGRPRDDSGFLAQLPRLLKEPLRELPTAQVFKVLPLVFLSQAVNAVGFFYEAYYHRQRFHEGQTSAPAGLPGRTERLSG
jgi:glycosyltransferase involved in cell wall biosynthesis